MCASYLRHVAMSAGALFFVGSTVAATIQVGGNMDPNNTADVTFEILGSSSDTALDLKVTLENTSPEFDPTITGFALTTDPLITGLNSMNSTLLIDWSANFDPGNINTPQPLGAFDLCVETGSGSITNCNGGNPNAGIAPGGAGMFTLQFAGTDLLTLTDSDFTPVAVRFQRTGPDGEGSDVAVCPNGDCTPLPTPEPIPEPATYLLMGSGLLAMGFFRTRIFARKD